MMTPIEKQEARVCDKIKSWQQAGAFLRGLRRDYAASEIRILRHMRRIALGEI
jgi:hypothetical protein